MSVRSRSRELTTELLSSPLLPVLGWTKAIESVIASGNLTGWLVYAVLITGVWVAGDEVRRRLETTAERAGEKVEDVAEDT